MKEIIKEAGKKEAKKFDGVCVAGCVDLNCCLVKVELFKEMNPASNLIGRMCPQCGTVFVVDLYDEIVTKNIPGLRMKFPLYRGGILTGKVAFWDFNSKKFEMSKESLGLFPKGPLTTVFSYYRKGILSGGIFEGLVFLPEGKMRGTLGEFEPHLYVPA